ncbi:MAG: histidine triad nucleotide-binding protein, partial [Planctomycetota bacterium]|nr:histidine triad nucleotide-binding protein [Planctomycetota bacterium]
MSEDCLFCRIVSGEMTSDIVYETDEVLAFRDISPQAPVHVLVIPKAHIATISEAPTDAGLFDKLYAAAFEVAKKEGIFEEGFRTVFNCHKKGGQVVFHMHMHLLGGRQMRANS